MKRFLLLLAVVFSLASSVFADIFTYVAAPDKNYSWQLVGEDYQLGITIYDVELVSQEWQGIVWKHRLKVAVPPNVPDETLGVLVITGSGGGKTEMQYAGIIAAQTGVPVAVLFDVPNQPLFDGKHEDEIIAYTFDKTLKTGDETWPLLFPMTKAAVRAMDALQELAAEGNKKVSGFITMGGSKRGWTTWFTSIVDTRVRGAIPIVYNNLNLSEQMRMQKKSFGAFSEQINDYTQLGLTDKILEGEARELMQIVDPYTYRNRSSVPKLMVCGTNDPYWPLEAMNLYYNDLVGQKYILYVPNKGHDVGDPVRLAAGFTSFIQKINGKLEYPNLEWTYQWQKDGTTLKFKSDVELKEGRVWLATSATRDFRQSKWEPTPVQKGDDGYYTYPLAKKDAEFVAVFGEAFYLLDKQAVYLSTDVKVLEPLNPPAQAK
ncbi:MAG TPA: PhoPQ-activated protein PqaA family protein [Candidatus Brocadiia bacterium]|nr:PhoPQ-activated protein PqaA family protein [Candidatus Brocadiia bacterium]